MVSLQSQIRWSVRAQWALGAALLALAGGFYFLAYAPRTHRLADLRGQIAQHQRNLAENKDQTKILPRVAADVEVLHARLERFKSVPKQQELPQFLRDVAQFGQQTGLRRFDLKPGVPTRDDRFNQLPLQLTFDGDFVNVYSFLRHTEDLRRLARVRAMNVRAKDRDGQVKVTLTMNIYFAGD